MTTLNPIRLNILRQIAHYPKPARHFTHGDSFIGSPAAIAVHLRVLQTHGHIDCNDGVYSITRSGQVTLDGYAPVSRWTGEVYKPPVWHVREGAENHKQYQSRGF